MRKLIKLDIIHPSEWLDSQRNQLANVGEMSIGEYRDWLNGLASNYSDFYTHYLNASGEWQAEEYYLLDEVFTQKMAQSLFGAPEIALRKLLVKLRKIVVDRQLSWARYVLQKHLERSNFDVLFVRSQPIPSSFWQRFRDRSLLVARLSARLPRKWHPNDFDLIYTDQPDIQTFFELQGTETIINKQGFDPRVAERLQKDNPERGVLFVGGLGTQNFLARTEFFETIAARVSLDWYGYWWKYGGDGRTLEDFPNLKRSFRGLTSGMQMYQSFHDAAICLNDYVDTANGIGYNQRMFEVMGAGGFLLTRIAPNFPKDFPPGIFATYEDAEDCLRQIDHYRKHPEERNAIARAGQRFVHENFAYSAIAASFSDDLLKRLNQRQRTN